MTNDEMLRATNNEDLIMDKSENEGKKMKIALFNNIEYGFESVRIITGNDFDFGEEYVLVSEVIDVEFPMIEVDLNAEKVKVIDKDIQKAKAGIELLEQAKAELLAIPDMRGE